LHTRPPARYHFTATHKPEPIHHHSDSIVHSDILTSCKPLKDEEKLFLEAIKKMNQQASIMKAKYASLGDEHESCTLSQSTHRVSDEAAIGIRASLTVVRNGTCCNRGSSSCSRSSSSSSSSSSSKRGIVEDDHADSHSDTSSDEFHEVANTALSTAIVASEKTTRDCSENKRHCVR
jgi:hypothetical protein